MENTRLVMGGVLMLAGVLSSLAADKPRYLRPADIDALPSAPPDAKIVYGTDPNQYADLRLPAGKGPHPVAIVIHGGCWIERYASAPNTAALADALRKEGVATFNIEYRRADQPGGGWPGTFLDVAAAADKLREIAAKYSLDLNRVITVGHSAGGHLGLWLAARPKLPKTSEVYSATPLKIHGVVPLGALGDLKQFQPVENEICGAPVVTLLMGGSAAQWPVRYAQGSPRELLPIGAPMIFINGENETISPPRVAMLFVDAAAAAGDDAVMKVVPNVGHHECNSPESPSWPFVRAAVKSLLGLK
ncbi:alpha/beta hydrolase family protein [Oleiharenicola lentus]|uniref:alpha/beta hydrolase family protein n=1 Tax=Oleiharenicola lentus TaxID=2508720 RepID=UPI003F660FD5